MLHMQEGGREGAQSSLIKKTSQSVYNGHAKGTESPMKMSFLDDQERTQAVRLRLMSCETYDPVMRNQLLLGQSVEDQESTHNEQHDLLMKVINNCNSEMAEKILSLLDSEGKEPLSDET